jgi:hypothetical protein
MLQDKGSIHTLLKIIILSNGEALAPCMDQIWVSINDASQKKKIALVLLESKAIDPTGPSNVFFGNLTNHIYMY